MNYRCTYEALKAAGHGPVKALEIVIDAMRGNRYALQWIRIVKRVSFDDRMRLASRARSGTDAPRPSSTDPDLLARYPEARDHVFPRP